MINIKTSPPNLANGQARSIGVANFTRRHLKEILASCQEPPEVVQTEAIYPRPAAGRCF